MKVAPFDFFITNAQRAPSQTPNRPSATMDRSVAVQKCARHQDGPRTCLPSLTPAANPRQPKSPTRGTTPDRVPAHQENEVCNNYSVISTRLCLFNHNRHRALSITCNPTPRPKFRVYFLRKYISIRTIIPAQNVPRGTLYVQSWHPYQRRDDEDMLSKGTGPVEDYRAGGAAYRNHLNSRGCPVQALLGRAYEAGCFLTVRK